MAIRDRVKNARAVAEEKRRTKTYGTHHAAVQAAARYCERTGEAWDVGYGGRCELDKRALKQWGYELFVAPIAKAWKSRMGRVLLIGVPIAALITLAMINGMWSMLLGVSIALGLMLIVAAAAFGVLCGMHTQRIGEMHSYLRKLYVEDKAKPFLAVPTAVVSTIGLPVILVSYGLYRFFKRWGKIVGRVLMTILALGFVAAVIGLFWQDPRRLLGVLGGFALLAVLAGIATLISAGVKHFKAKVAVKYKQSRQAAAYVWLEPLLRDAYNTGLSDKERTHVSFEEWTARVNDLLNRRGYEWSDLSGPHKKYEYIHQVAFRSGMQFKSVKTVDFHDIYLFTSKSYEAFLSAVWNKQHPKHAQKMLQREDRNRQHVERIDTIRNAWYAFKMGVCERVNLPPIEEVLGKRSDNRDTNASE